MALPLAGQIIRASDVSQYVTRYIIKGSAENVASSTTAQPDDELFYALTPGIWRVQSDLNVTGLSSTTLGGFNQSWGTTGTITSLERVCRGPGLGGTDMSTTTGTNNYRSSAHGLGTQVGYGAIGGSTAVIQEDLLVNCTVAGTLTLQWAQRVSNATATVVNSGSRLLVTMVEPA